MRPRPTHRRSRLGELGRRPLLGGLAISVAVSLVVGLAAYVLGPGGEQTSCTTGPVAAQAVHDLRTFTGWLRSQHVRGYVGEVGWPGARDAADWSDVASSWYDAADRDGLWVSAWAAGRWWPSSYPLTVYKLRGAQAEPVSRPQATVVEQHSRVPGLLRGVDLPSGAFGAGAEGARWYSNTRTGVFGTDYYYDDAADFTQLAATGAQVVRLSVTWERLQPRLDRPLDAREVARVGRALDAAQQAGLGVVLDLHNYGDYWVAAPGGGHRRLVLGSRRLPFSALVDFWRRTSRALTAHTSVLGLGLMNEPTDLASDPAVGARTWQRASQAVVTGLRAAGDRHVLMVSGYGGASPGRWTTYQPRAWIRDPLDQIRYEAHQYFDADRTGHYVRSFTEESARARAAGFTGLCTGTVAADPAPPRPPADEPRATTSTTTTTR